MELSVKEISEIRSLIKQKKKTQKEISDIYGCSRATVVSIGQNRGRFFSPKFIPKDMVPLFELSISSYYKSLHPYSMSKVNRYTKETMIDLGLLNE